jgi:signal peptidase II
VQERRSLATLIAVAGGVVVADHATKWLALRELDGGHTIDVVWTLRLRLIFNQGSAFGLGSRYTPLIAIFGVVVVIALVRFRHRVVGTAANVGLALLLGGAIGNLLDRLFRESGSSSFLGGPVVDFIDFQWWPVFNLADAAICVGAVLLAVTAGREEDEGEADPSVPTAVAARPPGG